MRRLFREITRLGGLASHRELQALGFDRWDIEIPVMYGKLIRVRHGWFAFADEPSEVVRAWRVGGRLACVSALAWHERRSMPPVLHVEVPGNAAQLRSPDDPRRRLDDGERVVVHWARRASEGDRRAVSVREAWRAAARCVAAQCEATQCEAGRIAAEASAAGAASDPQAASESASRMV